MRTLWMWMLLAVLVGSVAAQDGAAPAAGSEDDEPDPIAAQLELIEATAPAGVQVEYTLRYDKGENPDGGYGRGYPDGPGAIQQERPMVVQGYLVAPDLVATPDIMMHPRFIESIRVRHGDDVRDAQLHSYMIGQTGMLLRTAGVLEGSEPLAFNAEAEAPFWGMAYIRRGGRWVTVVEPLTPAVRVYDDGEQAMNMFAGDVVIDEDGRAVGMAFTDRLDLDGDWRGRPGEQPTISDMAYQSMLDDLRAQVEASVVRVRLSFRSPRQGSEQEMYRRYAGMGDEANQTERDVMGLILPEGQLVVLAQLDRQTTARLERIAAHPVEGEPVAAEFVASLRDFGCLLARLSEPLGEPLTLRTDSLVPLRGRLLPLAQVRIQGEQRTDYYQHTRIDGFEVGWRGNLYPGLSRRGDASMLIFDDQAQLAVLPITQRPRPGQDNRRYMGYGDEAMATPAALLAEALADLAESVDPDNIPLSEEEQARLAWLGVELQPLDRELARANNVSDLTGDGRFGALVSYVYPDSPAAEAGIDVGDILLRLHAPEYPQPIEVQVEPDRFGGQFPWDQLDQVPEQYLNLIPKPWPAAENPLSRAMTDIGFGQTFSAELFIDGELVEREFTVEQSPDHYDMAERYKSEALGVTVRNLTYEVRRYFLRTPDDPGVIISRLEPGGKAHTSGLRPYEIITHVNDEPVNNVEQYQQLIAGQDQLRLDVRRYTRGRVVPLRLDEPIDPATDEGEADDESEESAMDGE